MASQIASEASTKQAGHGERRGETRSGARLYEHRLSHYAYIDALRGLAFLNVFAIHLALHLRPFRGEQLLGCGKYGVQLFFVVSAITLFRSFSIRSHKEQHPLRNFYIRRFFRIAPLFWTGIVFYALFTSGSYSNWRPDGMKSWQIITAFLFVHGWTPESIEAVVPGGWSIAVEMTFYACLPWLYRRVRSATGALLGFGVSVVAAVALNLLVLRFLPSYLPPRKCYLVPEFVYFWFPSQLPVFLLGALAYHLLHDVRFTSFVTKIARKTLCFGIGFWALCVWLDLPMAVMPHLFFAIAFVFVVVGLAAQPVGIFVNRGLTNLGTISFSCYVTHFAALGLVGRLLRLAQLHVALPDAFAFQFLLNATAALALTIGVSTITYNLVERPGIAAGNWLIGRWERVKGGSR